jgi:hypothetical protein
MGVAQSFIGETRLTGDLRDGAQATHCHLRAAEEGIDYWYLEDRLYNRKLRALDAAA